MIQIRCSLPAALSFRPALCLAILAMASSCCLAQNDESAWARTTRKELIEKILPYWHDTAVDRTNGGFILADDGSGQPSKASEKQLVTQSRMVWGFSHAAIKKLGDGNRDYLADARQGYEFLVKNFRDSEHGGYFWSTDLSGKVTNPRKIVYGESFVIYALVEYYRASKDAAALQHAVELFNVLQSRAHDKTNGGWVEHFQRDWTPLPLRSPEAMVEVGGLKSANTHLHLMEALTELHLVTRDADVRKALIQALEINQKYFYPPVAGNSAFHRHPDWKPVQDASSAGLSYGHNVEFAWLMIHAERALGRNPSWNHFYAHVNHALAHGYDHQRGGVYNRGFDDKSASDTDKVWWVQSEMLAALTYSLQNQPNDAHRKALLSLLNWIAKYQAPGQDRIWLDTVTADGKPKSPSKAHNWKANYHDVRAQVIFSEAFGK